MNHVVHHEVRDGSTVEQTFPIEFHKLVETVVSVSSQKIIKG